MSAELLDAVRKEAKPGLWASGVKLARAGAVVQESQTPAEVVMRVKAAGKPVALTVVLYPGDVAWECTCDGHFDPCEHVCAAAITLQQAASHDAAVPTADSRWSRVVYRFARADGGLTLQRMLAHADGTQSPLDAGLKPLLAQASSSSKLQLEQCDLQADRLLELRPVRGPLPPERLDGLLGLLEPARNVLLDGNEVAISSEVVLPKVVVNDLDDGTIEVTIARDPRLTEVLSPGVGLCGDTLCRLGETALTGERLQNLPSVRRYQASQLGELTGSVLPELARRFPVEVKSRRLPRFERALTPRIALELNRLDSGLSVLPTLVYGAPPHVRIDGGRMVYLRGTVPVRDEVAERRQVQLLRDQLDLVPGRRLTVQGPEMAKLADRLRKWRGALTGDAAGVVSPNARLVPKLQLHSRLGEQGRPEVDFGFEFQLEGNDAGAGTVSGQAVLDAWRDGLGLVPLDGGGWANLPLAWLDQHGQRVADLLAARKDNGQLEHHALPQLGELCQSLDTPPPPGLERLLPLVQGFEQLPLAPLPADLTAQLRPYQRHGVNWLHFLQQAALGGVLADDMGLGKTLQALCVLGPRSLVVCPTSVLPNWRSELQRFRPGLKVCTYHGPGRALDEAADVTVTTYALLRLDAATLGSARWSTVVLDEAQAIKNPDSQATRAAFSLQADFKLALSGTPIENRLDELWSVMHFCNPGLLGGRGEFDGRWAQPIAEGREGAAAALRRRLKPFVLRRLKSQVAPELPLRTESVLHVTLEDRERAVYDAVLAATRADVVSLLNEGGSVLKALEALLRLRQAACHSALVPGQQASTSSKVRALLEALGTAAADGHKALVFSQWTKLLDLIEPELKAAGLLFERLDGSTTNRGEVVERFQAEGGAPVMLISLKAGGTGLNLTAADHVFLVDPWWNPAVEAQAADRAHRIGQTRPVNIYRLVSQGTVEEKILQLQAQKRALFEAALGEGTAAGGLTREDLLQLFE